MKISIIYPDRVTESKGGWLSVVDDTIECNFEEFKEVLCLTHIAPAVFEDNKKCQANMKQIELLVFDFDSGESSEKISKQLKEYNYVVGASKNHLVDKGDGKGIIERFHVFIKTEPITSVPLYKYIIKKFAGLNKWEIDSTCSDPSRYYYTHKEILFSQNNNKDLELKPFVRMKEAEERISKFRQEQFKKINEDLDAVEAFKRTRYFTELQNLYLGGTGRYAKRCSIVGAMKACGLNSAEAISLFIEYNALDGKFNQKSIDKLYRSKK